MANMANVFSMPQPRDLYEQLGNSIGGLGQAIADPYIKKTAMQQELEQQIALAQAKAQIEQQAQSSTTVNATELLHQIPGISHLNDPLTKILNAGKVIEAYKNAGVPAPQGLQQIFQGQQPQQSIQQFGQMPVISENGAPQGLVPEQYKPNAFGQLMPTSYLNPSVEKQKAELQAQGASRKEQLTNLGKLNRLNTIIDTISKEWIKTAPPGSRSEFLQGVIGRPLASLSAVGAKLQATEGQRKDASYISFVNGIRAQLARSMGDVGNLSEYEQRAVLALVPSINDTKEVGLEKIAKLKSLISEFQAQASATPQNIQSAPNQQLDKQTAMQLLQQAGGDRNKARQLATQMGYSF